MHRLFFSPPCSPPAPRKEGWGLFGPVAGPTCAIIADCLAVAMAMASTQRCGAAWCLSHGHAEHPPLHPTAPQHRHTGHTPHCTPLHTNTDMLNMRPTAPQNKHAEHPPLHPQHHLGWPCIPFTLPGQGDTARCPPPEAGGYVQVSPTPCPSSEAEVYSQVPPALAAPPRASQAHSRQRYHRKNHPRPAMPPPTQLWGVVGGRWVHGAVGQGTARTDAIGLSKAHHPKMGHGVDQDLNQSQD